MGSSSGCGRSNSSVEFVDIPDDILLANVSMEEENVLDVVNDSRKGVVFVNEEKRVYSLKVISNLLVIEEAKNNL